MRNAAEGFCIAGELAEKSPGDAVKILGEYEGYFPLRTKKSLFVRTVTPVILEDGGETKAWVYFYNGPVDEDNLIPGGDYRGRANLRSADTRRVR